MPISSNVDSRRNLKACFPELGSTFSLVAPVEVVHALNRQIAVSKAEGRLRKIYIYLSISLPSKDLITATRTSGDVIVTIDA